MAELSFLDTNVLVYAYQNTDSRKQPLARDLLRKAIAGECVISSQVLSEFAATLLHKFPTPPNAEELAEIFDRLEPIKLILSDMQIIRRAAQAHRSYRLHFYDSLIVAAAERAGCARIWSEDFSAGQKYFGVTVVNPFA
jgi:predicted nucleic acid-binding protein